MNGEASETLTETDERDDLALHGYRLAAGLIWRDRHALLMLPLILAVPGTLRVIIANDSTGLHAFTSLILEMIRLALLYLLTMGLIKPYQENPDHTSLRTLFVWGGALWCISMLPSIAIFSNGLTLIISAFLCYACTLMFYFFFTPIIIGSGNFTEIMQQTIRFTSFDTLMPLRALFTPFALAVFLAAIASDPMPSTSSLVYHEVCYALATTLSTYCSVAFGVSFWARYLAPESQAAFCLERTKLIEEQAPEWIDDSLNFRSGIVLALLALVFWSSSITSIYSLSQNASVEIARTTIQNRSITLQLNVRDTPSSLRHFHPMLLSLASDNRRYLAQYPSRIILNNEIYTPSQTIYSYDTRSIQDGVLHIAIHFDVDRDITSISKLKDVYLWYATTKISRVNTDQRDESQRIELPATEISTGEIKSTETPNGDEPVTGDDAAIREPDMQALPYTGDLIPEDDTGLNEINIEKRNPYVDVENSRPLRVPLYRSGRLRGSRA